MECMYFTHTSRPSDKRVTGCVDHIDTVNNIQTVDRKRGGGGVSLELNQLQPYKDMLCVRRWSDAGLAGRVRGEIFRILKS